MVDQVGIYNLAVSAIGGRNSVSLPTENSREAEVCNLWYPIIVEQVLASAAWPEATKFDYLALLNEQDDETWALGEARPGYTYLYGLPADSLRPQYLSSYEPFKIATNGSQGVLMTNSYQAILAYTVNQPLISLWSPELQMAIAMALAANICMPLTGKPSRAKMLIEQANNLIIGARETAANMDSERMDSIPDWILARGFTDTSSRSRYFHPYGSLLQLTNVN